MGLWRSFIVHCWGLLGGDRKKYLTFFVFLAIILTYELVPPYAVGKIVDFFSEGKNETEGLTFPFAVIAVIGILWGLVSITRLWLKNQLTQLNIKLEHKARLRCFSTISNKSLAWHDDMSSGEKLQRVTTGAEAMKEALGTGTNRTLNYVSQAFGISLFFLSTQWPLFIIFALYLTLFVTLQVRFQRKIVIAESALQETRERASGQIVDKLGNIRTTKVLGRTKSSVDDVKTADQKLEANALYIAKLSYRKWISFQITNGAFLSAAMFYVAAQVDRGAISIGEIMVYLAYTMTALTNMGRLSTMLR